VSSSDTPYDPDLAPTMELDEDDWDDAPITPRARIPRPTKLLAMLAVAVAAFAGGIFAQRHWGSSSSVGSQGGSSAAARLANAGLTGQAATRRFGANGGTGTGAGGGLADATIGQVSYLKGTTLYVTDTSGNIVKVTVPKGTPVTKSVSTGLTGVRPGDTVVIRGSQGKSGTVTATSVSVGGAGAGGGFGGSAAFGGAGGTATTQRPAGG
jgi:hypothetical protein